MSAKTKIVVLRMKEVIYTGIFAALGILLLVLLLMIFLPEKEGTSGSGPARGGSKGSAAISASSEALYIPGLYTTELILGKQTVDIEVIVAADSITSLALGELSDDVITLYPLLEPTFNTISKQICETQSLEDITYTADSKYTSLVIVEAIRSSLDKALITPQPSEASGESDSDAPAESSSTTILPGS